MTETIRRVDPNWTRESISPKPSGATTATATQEGESDLVDLDFLKPKNLKLVIDAQLHGFETDKIFLNARTYNFLREARDNGTIDRVISTTDKRGRPKVRKLVWYFICTDATGTEISELFDYKASDGALVFFRRFVKNVYQASEYELKEKYPKKHINVRRKVTRRIIDMKASQRHPQDHLLEVHWDTKEEFYQLARSMGLSTGKLLIGGNSGRYLKTVMDNGILTAVQETVLPEIWEKYYPMFCFFVSTNASLERIAELFDYRDRESVSRNMQKFIDLLYAHTPSEIKKGFPRKSIKPRRSHLANWESQLMEGSKNEQVVSMIKVGMNRDDIARTLDISSNNLASRIIRLKKRNLI